MGRAANPLDRTRTVLAEFTYLTDVFVNNILPNKKPDLTIFWSKEPDATTHAYGPGTYNSIDATRMNDEILGEVVDKISELGWSQTTDIIITQDHNHSTVSGDLSHYPLRRIIDGDVGSQNSNGYSVSGFVRTAELLTRDGIKAYDGAGCRDVPTLSGILSDGTHLQAATTTRMAAFAVKHKRTPREATWCQDPFPPEASLWPPTPEAIICSSPTAIPTPSRPL